MVSNLHSQYNAYANVHIYSFPMCIVISIFLPCKTIPAYTQLAQKFYSRGKLEITFFSCSFNGNAFSWLKVRLQNMTMGYYFYGRSISIIFMHLRCQKLFLNEYFWQHRFKKMIMLSSKLLEPINGNIATIYIIYLKVG